MCFKIFTVRLTKGLCPACLMEASFSVSAPDGAMVQVLRTRFHLKNEFGNQSCCHPSFNRVCSVFQIVDQESKTEFNVVVAVFFFFSDLHSHLLLWKKDSFQEILDFHGVSGVEFPWLCLTASLFFCSVLPFCPQESELLRVAYSTRLVAYFTRGMGAKEECHLKGRVELLMEQSSR